jgi:hypothetical protein
VLADELLALDLVGLVRGVVARAVGFEETKDTLDRLKAELLV